jgi:predicted ATPase
VLAYPAVRLFVERISARGGDFSLSDDEAPIAAEICRKLDGIALAIELAAGRAANFGVTHTFAKLGSRLDFLKFGSRTANPRHQTLKASFDWSHDHLSEVERVVLRRVAIFIGPFTPEAALAVANEAEIGQSEIEGSLETCQQIAHGSSDQRSRDILPIAAHHALLCIGETRWKRRA